MTNAGEGLERRELACTVAGSVHWCSHDGKWYRVHAKSLSCVWLFATPWTIPTRLLRPWDSPGKNTGVGSHFLQGIFPTQGLKPGLLHCMWVLYHQYGGSLKKQLEIELGFPGGSEVKASASITGDLGLIPGSERSPGFPWKRTEIILSFLRLHPSIAFGLFCWLWWLLHFFSGILAHSGRYNVHLI